MSDKPSREFGASGSPYRLPGDIPGNGVLVGWSLELAHRPRNPIGFSYGPKKETPERVVDPVLLEGEGHLITVAPTGAGKGVACIVPALLRYGGPVIVIDPKGENVEVTARRRRELGQTVIVLDPMGVTGQSAARLNPLDVIDPNGPTAVDDAATLADQLLGGGDPRNAFWEGRARQLLTGVILHVLTDFTQTHRTLTQVRLVINRAAGDTAGLMAALRGSRHPEARNTAELLGIAAPETIGGIVAHAQEGIDFIRGPLIQRATEDSTFDLSAVTRGDPLSIFIVLPPHMLISHGRLLRLWIGALMIAIMRRRARPAQSTLFILDEAAQLGPFNELRQAVTLLRGYGLRTWSFWQDASQLRQLYPEDWQVMVNNCKVVQCFGANTMLAANDMAAIVGWRDGASVLNLAPDEMLLQIAGDEAVVAKTPNYLTDPAFAGMFDTNPFHDPNRDPVGPARTPIVAYVRPPPGTAGLATAGPLSDARPLITPSKTAHAALMDRIPVPEHAAMAQRLIDWHRQQTAS
ncbi:MAG: type IV secretory system conjugative DNA transfer family protein [Caulobacter sp.]